MLEKSINSMEKEFIPYSLALRMKELGFDEPCFGYYIELVNPIQGILTIEKCDKDMDGCLAPTFSQAFRWFREMYGLDSFCRQTNLDGRSYFKISRIETDEIIRGYSNFTSTYEEAEIACLQKLIEMVEK